MAVIHSEIGDVVRLSDGRVLAFAEYGNPSGAPVIFIPGYEHSRFAHAPVGKGAAEPQARVIAIDLPGFGRSDPNPGYRLLDWVDDIAQLTDALGLPRFAALGWSWGGPYALAMAHRIPERITALGLVSALGGWLAGPGASKDLKREFRTFGSWCRFIRPAVRLFLWQQRRTALRDPDAALAKEAAGSPPSDQEVYGQPQMRSMLRASKLGAWAQGIDGMYAHSLAIALPWGFTLKEVATPAFIWQGDADPEILPAMAHRMAAELPYAQAEFVQAGGHLLVFSRWAEILQRLTQTKPAQAP